jgi:MFS family permease
MVNIDNKRGLKYFLFGNLYFSEGLMIAVTTVATLLYLREKAVPIPVTTLIVGIVNIPWMLKFVWGPVIDYFIRFGRKTFIILGGTLTVSCMFLVSLIDPSVSLLPFTILIFLSHVGIGFIDVSTDAWAIDVSTEKDREKKSMAQCLQVNTQPGRLVQLFSPLLVPSMVIALSIL